MALEFAPLPNGVGSEVRGLDTERIDAAARASLQEAFLQNSVLLIRGVPLTPDDHVAITRILGEPEIHPMAVTHVDGYPEIIVPKPYGLADAEDPEEIVGRIPWNSDLTYLQRPGRGALLRAIEIPPEGGETGFIDSAAVYEALSEREKSEIHGLELVHSMLRSRRILGLPGDDALAIELRDRFPDVVHPIVRIDPVSGIRSLDTSPMFVSGVVGWPADKSDELLRRLLDFATQDRFVYWHKWIPDDLVIWNNRRTLHCAAGSKMKYRRIMNRTTLLG